MKLLRKAVAGGRRIRVQSYSENVVVEALADADIVLFGIDYRDPVLSGEQLVGCRDFAARPLTVVDFNTFGSTTGLDVIDGVSLWCAERLDEEVAGFTKTMCATEQFAQAADEAESWINEQLGGESSAAPVSQSVAPSGERGSPPAHRRSSPTERSIA